MSELFTTEQYGGNQYVDMARKNVYGPGMDDQHTPVVSSVQVAWNQFTMHSAVRTMAVAATILLVILIIKEMALAWPKISQAWQEYMHFTNRFTQREGLSPGYNSILGHTENNQDSLATQWRKAQEDSTAGYDPNSPMSATAMATAPVALTQVNERTEVTPRLPINSFSSRRDRMAEEPEDKVKASFQRV